MGIDTDWGKTERHFTVEGGKLELTALRICDATLDVGALQMAGASIVDGELAVVTEGQALRVLDEDSICLRQRNKHHQENEK